MRMPLRRRYRWSSLTAILLLGVLLRLNLSVKAFFSTFDTSTVGLMALHILEGERPLFYYGQNYMGALEAYVAAVMFSLFGVSTTSLSLALIAFASGWILAMHFLFSELLDPRAGLAAALCTAAGGWYAMWFSTASYGGYADTFFFGIVFLTLAVRLAGRELTAAARWSHALCLGITAALGIWTNFQVFSYLATGGLVLLAGMRDAKTRRLLLRPVLTAGVIALAGFWPLLKVTGGVWGFPVEWGAFSLAAVPAHARLLLARLPKLFLWPVDMPGLLLKGALTAWLAGAFLSLVKVLLERRRKERLMSLVPPLFAVVFLVFYVAHPLSGAGATRYLVPLATMVTAWVFGAAVSHRWRAVRWTGYVLLAVWTLFNTASVLQTAEVRAKEKREMTSLRTAIVRQAVEEGVRHLMILGSDIDGFRGQSLTFHARDRVRFVSSSRERYYPASVSAELDPLTGFVFNGRHLEKVRKSLAAAGVTSYRERHAGWSMLHGLEIPFTRRRSVLPGEMSLQLEGASAGRSASLADRLAATSVDSLPGEGASITALLDQPRRIGSLWLTSVDTSLLPSFIRVSVSQDGVQYTPVGSPHENILPAYTAGNRVYVMGYHARVELRFDAVRTRFLRLEFGPGDGRARGWSVNELFLFEDEGRAEEVSRGEVEEIAGLLRSGGVDFAVADRWLSARLGALEDGPGVFPLFNPLHAHTLMSRRFSPRAGLGVLVAREVAEEAERVIGGALSPQTSLQRRDFPHYVLFTFGGSAGPGEREGPALEWNGHTVLSARPVAGR